MDNKYKHGDTIILNGNGLENRERLIVRKLGRYFLVDIKTGKAYEPLSNTSDFSTANELVEVYEWKGYSVTLKPRS